MSFHATIHPFLLPNPYKVSTHFFAALSNRQELLVAIKSQLKMEKGSDYTGEEREGVEVVGFAKIARSNFLGNLQEFAAHMDDNNIEAIYKGLEQTRFNHLIEIRNNMGIFLPTFFLFPLRIAIKQNALPIFVGSTLKLQAELMEIQQELQPHDNVKLGEIKDRFEAGEEDLEDYEASHEGAENFWPSFSYIILEKLVKRSIQAKLPIFIL